MQGNGNAAADENIGLFDQDFHFIADSQIPLLRDFNRTLTRRLTLSKANGICYTVSGAFCLS